MEANVTGETRGLYGPGGADLNGIGRRKGLEWDLNDWSWDGDLFLATPVNTVSPDCRNKQLLPIPVNGELSGNSRGKEVGLNGNVKVDSEKRRRIAVVEEMDEPDQEEAGPAFSLRLGRQVYPINEATDCAEEDGNNNSKRSKLQAGNANRGVCQVEGCGADLSNAKDYHRRHKVCEMHAKASKALVANVMQRFCQQCSRFHLLQEFDEEKKSCRRRLAGHNRRRRKTHPDGVAAETSLDTQATSYILISLLRILSNLQSNTSEQAKQQDLLSHFLSSLASLAGSVDARKLSSLLEASQNQEKIVNSVGTSSEAAHPDPTSNGVTAQAARNGPGSTEAANESNIQRAEPPVERSGIRNFDLNDIYNDGPIVDEPAMAGNTSNLNIGSPSCPPWLLQNPHRQSPPQTSGTSNSTSDDSLGSANEDGHSRTGRIVFKLFGKDPNDFPLDLRRQIIGWLSSTPTDIESYIRPGCIILTVYLRLSVAKWEDLCYDPKSSLRKLFDLVDDYFWKSGWVYVRWQHLMAFVYNGHIVLDAPLLVDSHNQSKILSVFPVAVPFSARINFTVKGFDLVGHTQRLLCAFDGKYLVQEATHSLADGAGNPNDMLQCLRFSCDTPSVMGRGFVEIEDHGLGGASFPFIVAEPDVCTEICSLQHTIDWSCSQQNFVYGLAGSKARAQALNFLDEMGWLLRSCQLMSKAADLDTPSNFFSLSRFKWLIVFSMEHDWCAVVKKLLDIFVEGSVDLGGRTSGDALKEVAPLHHAVRFNSKRMVELLLRYKSGKSAEHVEYKKADGTDSGRFLFRPDMVEVGDITPLHLAACRADAIDVLDALTNDPGRVGIMTWKTARDSGNSTPEDYARCRGLVSYLRLVEKKINEKSGSGHVVDIPMESILAATNALVDRSMLQRNQQSSCKICSRQQLAYINRHRSSLLYRPAMLSMVGIAAVCVCVALLLKGPPEVRFVLSPFRWESLHFGAI